jgi:hypothetical protein
MISVIAQESGDLRNNPVTKKLEIYINEIISLDYDTTKTGDYYFKENKLTKWCNFDSLYEKHGDTFDYYWGSLNLSYIMYHRKLFNFFMEERESTKPRLRKISYVDSAYVNGVEKEIGRSEYYIYETDGSDVEVYK